MADKEQYKALLSDIIAHQSVILGPDIALLKARKVAELALDESGKVKDIKGDPAKALKKLVDEYVALSGDIVKNALGPIFKKHPSLASEKDFSL